MLEFLTNPDEFFEKHRDIGFAIPFAIVLISGILGVLMIYSNMDILMETLFRRLQNVPAEEVRLFIEVMKVYILVSPIIGVFISWLVITVLIYILSAIFGGEGDFFTLMKFTAFGFVPGIVLFPVNILIVKMTHSFTGIPIEIVGLASTLWQILILTFATKHAREVDTPKAFASVVISVVLLLALGFAGKLFRMR